MVKYNEEKYPLGSFPNQRTAGRYLDTALYNALEIMAKATSRDMTWLLVLFSSTLEVGTGKSTFAQQIADAWIYIVNKMYNLNLTFDMKNIVFKPKDVIARAFKLPKFSVIIIDEWDDFHYMSELGMTLREFFRKCRQLNLFIIIIIPNFFQLPMGYAISRSVACIDVRFSGEFERGFFNFYNFPAKKDLYLKGKKTQDYKVVAPTFSGRFTEGYCVDEKEYRKAKLKDMIDSEQKSKPLTETQIKAKMFKEAHAKNPDKPVSQLAEAFGVSSRTAWRWLEQEDVRELGDTTDNTNYPIQDDDVSKDDENLEPEPSEQESDSNDKGGAI